MKYSDDEGETWSDLQIVSTFKPEESKFLVLGPGVGKQIANGEHAGRLIVPLYSKSSAELGFMYSDDHGNNWTYVEADQNTGGANRRSTDRRNAGWFLENLSAYRIRIYCTSDEYRWRRNLE